ncbi:hypothetical protein LTR22_027971 [Elasticomyces elasticus]|nr:hypothetical protein LTR22_027971 [Elasticomyces elasticus]
MTDKPEDGAFSLFCRITAGNAAALPEEIKYTEGVVLGLTTDTAADEFQQPECMGLEFPFMSTKSNIKSEVVVVYSGSSSVGCVAIQLAVNAGYRVLATANPKHFTLAYLALKSGHLRCRGRFLIQKCSLVPDIASAVGTDRSIGFYNAIGIPESFDVVTPMVEKLGGGFVANTKPPGKLPDFINAKYVLGVNEYGWPM